MHSMTWLATITVALILKIPMISGQINTTPVLISKDYNKIECTLACPSKPMRNHTLTKSNSLLRLPPLIPVEMSQLALT